MAMTKNRKYLSILLILGATAAAQEQTAEPLGFEEEADIPPTGAILRQDQVPVADEGIEEDGSADVGPPEANAEQTIPGIDDEELLVTAFELFKQLMDDNVLDEADTVAKRIVEMTIDQHGPQSNEFAKALTNLAIVQFRTEQYDPSVQNFETAISIIETNEDRLNAQLINPLKGLGDAQLAYGRPDLANRTYKRAIHVTHVNEGPHNMDQIDLLESIAETHARMDDMEAAKEVQDQIYALNIRAHEVDSLALVPTLMRRAKWQHRSGYIFDERATYRRAIRIIEEADGKDSLALVEPLILLGRSYFFLDRTGKGSYQESTMSTGEIYFRRAARIATENPDSNWQILAQSYLALGDYYIYGNVPQRAWPVYEETWALLSQDEERLEFRRERLEMVNLLREGQLPLYVNSGSSDTPSEGQQDDPASQGTVSLSYGVTQRGRAVDIKLITAEPPEFEDMLERAVRELRRRIYRPRMVDGKAVGTENLTFEHKFFYRQSDLIAVRQAAEEDDR